VFAAILVPVEAGTVGRVNDVKPRPPAIPFWTLWVTGLNGERANGSAK